MGIDSEASGADTRRADGTLTGDSTVGVGQARGTPAIPDEVGRFEVLEQLGAGGMGVVYAGRDQALGRMVALKFLRTADATSASTQSRLLREAKALARVSHPNVIQVFDVGTVDGRVYVAMEFIDGMSVRAWLADSDRRADEVLEVFCAAGRGLEAAHEAGVVHRDFKPDNVMIGRDGKVVVLDFGIAHAVDGSPFARTDVQTVDESSETTTIAGTPRYMAPEQFARKPTDGRTDVFSFCVALWEALYGEHPFAPRDATAMMLAVRVLDGDLRAEPRVSDIRPEVGRALRRGLSTDPGERFGTMGELLEALAGPPRTRLRWIGIAALALLGTGSALWAGLEPAAAPCIGGWERLDGVWDEQRREALHARFEALEQADAMRTHERVQSRLDAYAEDWATEHDEACAATHVLREQPASMLDARMLCLQRHRARLLAGVDALSKTTAETLANAVAVTVELPAVTACSDEATLRSPTIPVPAALAGSAEKLYAAVAASEASHAAGQYPESLAFAEEAFALAGSLEHAPLRARARMALARALDFEGKHEAAEELATSAYHEARGSRDDETAFDAATFLLVNIGAHQRRPDDGLRWADVADALLANDSSPTPNTAELAQAHGVVLWRAERVDEARVLLERSLRLHEQVGSQPATVAEVETMLGAALYSVADNDAAHDVLRSALDKIEGVFGPDHPRVASPLNNLAAVAYQRGDFTEAAAMFERVAELEADAHGPRHPKVASALNNLGVLYTQLDEDENARDTYRRVLDIYDETLPPQHPERGSALNNLGWSLHQLGEFEAGQKAFRESLEISAANGLDGALALEGLGECLLSLDQPDEGLAKLEKAVELRESNRAPDHPQVAEALHRLGWAYVQHDRPDDAVPLLERARRIRADSLPESHPDNRNTLAALTHAYADSGRAEAGLEAADAFARLPGEPPARLARRVAFDEARLKSVEAPQEAQRRVLALRAELNDDDPLVETIDAWLER